MPADDLHPRNRSRTESSHDRHSSSLCHSDHSSDNNDAHDIMTLHQRGPSNEEEEVPLIGSPSAGNKNNQLHHNHHHSSVAADIELQEQPPPTTPARSGGQRTPLLKAKNSDMRAVAIDSAGDAKKEHHANAVKALTACGLYSFCSVSMILVNKSLASSYNHLIHGDLNILLVVFQAIVAVIAVELCRYARWVEYPPLNTQILKAWAPVNMLFCAMLFTGMASLQNNSVPMVTVFKNITNVITTAGDYAFFGSKPEALVMVAFGVMVFGAIAAARKDITINVTGLFWMMANCFSTAAYVLYMKHATQDVKIPKFGMVFVNNVLCVAFLLPVAFLMGEVLTFVESDDIHTPDYYMKNLFAGLVGFFLNFASLNCVQATGPTTYAIVGSLNKIPVAFLGYIIFDSVITSETWFYIAVSMCGGFIYSFAKLESSNKVQGRKN